MGRSDACVGIVANPVSARDIRRVIANANTLQVTDRANMVLRVLSALGACGVDRVLMMPDSGGIRGPLQRALARENNVGHGFPRLDFLTMPVTSTVEDTFRAVRLMRGERVRAIIVLGGDGTHRAVIRQCDDIPIAGLSTGTNNAFPETREPTVTGMAVGLYATGRLASEQALAPNKCLEISVNDDEVRDIALVDVVVSAERFVGARALWKPEHLRRIFVTFADPEAIGMSAVAGLLQPVGRQDSGGLTLEILPGGAEPAICVTAPIAPGMLRKIRIGGVERMHAGRAVRVEETAGTIALDGERELEFGPGDRVSVTLREQAFHTVDVSRCMRTAAFMALFADSPQKTDTPTVGGTHVN